MKKNSEISEISDLKSEIDRELEENPTALQSGTVVDQNMQLIEEDIAALQKELSNIEQELQRINQSIKSNKEMLILYEKQRNRYEKKRDANYAIVDELGPTQQNNEKYIQARKDWIDAKEGVERASKEYSTYLENQTTLESKQKVMQVALKKAQGDLKAEQKALQTAQQSPTFFSNLGEQATGYFTARALNRVVVPQDDADNLSEVESNADTDIDRDPEMDDLFDLSAFSDTTEDLYTEDNLSADLEELDDSSIQALSEKSISGKSNDSTVVESYQAPSEEPVTLAQLDEDIKAANDALVSINQQIETLSLQGLDEQELDEIEALEDEKQLCESKLALAVKTLKSTSYFSSEYSSAKEFKNKAELELKAVTKKLDALQNDSKLILGELNDTRLEIEKTLSDLEKKRDALVLGEPTEVSEDKENYTPESIDSSLETIVEPISEIQNFSEKTKPSIEKSTPSSQDSRETKVKDRKIVSSIEQQVLSDEKKLKDLNNQQYRWLQAVSSKDTTEKTLKKYIEKLEEISGDKPKFDRLLKQAQDQLGIVKNAIESSKAAYDKKGPVGQLFSRVLDFIIKNIFRTELDVDKNKRLFKQYSAKADEFLSQVKKIDINIADTISTIQHYENELEEAEEKISKLDYKSDTMAKEVRSLELKLANKDQELSVIDKSTTGLVERCKPDFSLGLLRAKESSAVLSTKIALKEFLENPTEATLSSLSEVMKTKPEAYLENKTCSELLKDAAVLYPEIDTLRVQKAQITNAVRADSSSSTTDKIKKNEREITRLKQERRSLELEKNRLDLVDEIENPEMLDTKREELALLSSITLEKYRERIIEEYKESLLEEYKEEYGDDYKAHFEEEYQSRLNEPGYQNISDEACQALLEEEKHEIQEYIQKVEPALEKAQALDSKIDALNEEIEGLQEANEVFTTQKNQDLNKEIDKLVARCDMKKSGFVARNFGKTPPEVIVTSALKTFILAPTRENLMALTQAQKDHPVTNAAEKAELDQLVNDALSLVKADLKGYDAALVAREPLEQSTPNKSGSYKERLGAMFQKPAVTATAQKEQNPEERKGFKL